MRRCYQWIFVLMLSVICAYATHGQDQSSANLVPKHTVASWSDTVDSLKREPALADALPALVKRARDEVKKGLVRRVYRLADVGKHRTSLDGRSKVLEDEIRETFALAMSDFSACNHLAGALPLVAAASKLTGDTAMRGHVLAQLREMSGWSPLQRPGWTLYKPGNRLGADGKDGNWLATGCGVRAIVTTLDIMGDDVDAALHDSFRKLLSAEIAGVVDDWNTKRPWFVRTDNARTNQWVLPNEGLIRACLYVGRDKHRDAYELGVKNLLRALSSHGPEGEFDEGIGYALFTVKSMLHAARAMAVAGDRRAIDHRFLARFGTWAVHHLQPGRMTVNCFDAGRAKVPRNHAHWRNMLSLLVFAGGSAEANWALFEQFDGPTDDLMGLLARVTSHRLQRRAPSLFKAYPRAPMVVWRDGWDDDATGVWVRGGHLLDGHDHQDRGHVNYIAHGKPILIEAGTPSYHNPDMGVHYSSGVGHNVLQVGTFFPERPYPAQSRAKYVGWQQPHGIAPIKVNRLDAAGGAVVVDAGRCYAETDRWVRHVEWTRTKLSVRDEVTLKKNKRDIVMFRWHLGTAEAVTVTDSDDGKAFTIGWPDARMTMKANQALEVRTYQAPDATVTGKQDHQHTCVEVRTRVPADTLDIVTTIHPLDS